MTRYEPPDALRSPRYTGVRTFARCPHVADSLDDVDVAVVGVPFDTGTTMRPGARFGPEAIRSASVMLRPYNPAQETAVFGAISVVDRGDLAVTPQNGERTAGQIAEQLVPVVAAGAALLVVKRPLGCWVAVRHAPQQQAVGLGDGLRHGYGPVR